MKLNLLYESKPKSQMHCFNLVTNLLICLCTCTKIYVILIILHAKGFVKYSKQDVCNCGLHVPSYSYPHIYLYNNGKAWLGFNDCTYDFWSKDSVRKWQLLWDTNRYYQFYFYDIYIGFVFIEFVSALYPYSFWHAVLLLFVLTVYLVTQGVNPREHAIKQELVRMFSLWHVHAFSVYLHCVIPP